MPGHVARHTHACVGPLGDIYPTELLTDIWNGSTIGDTQFWRVTATGYSHISGTFLCCPKISLRVGVSQWPTKPGPTKPVHSTVDGFSPVSVWVPRVSPHCVPPRPS